MYSYQSISRHCIAIDPLLFSQFRYTVQEENSRLEEESKSSMVRCEELEAAYIQVLGFYD